MSILEPLAEQVCFDRLSPLSLGYTGIDVTSCAHGVTDKPAKCLKQSCILELETVDAGETAEDFRPAYLVRVLTPDCLSRDP